MKKLSFLAIPALLLACGAYADQRGADWDIGPKINGKNYSVGMPSRLYDSRDGASFDFPYPRESAGHVHYVTKPTGPLDQARRVTLRYRIDAVPGARFIARERPDLPATLSLYFQRGGDNWSARGRYETYRWYVTKDHMIPLRPGVHEVTVNLTDDWRGVGGSTAKTDPREFRDALANADRIGFVFGNPTGRGHGVYSTAPARFTVLDFDVR